MSKSTTSPGDEFLFSSEGDAETFVRTLMEHRGFCYWCLAPLEVNPIVQFPDEPEGWTLETAKTFDEYGNPVDDVPPDRTDNQGQVVEPSHDEETICGSCGTLDVGPGYTRSKETTRRTTALVRTIGPFGSERRMILNEC